MSHLPVLLVLVSLAYRTLVSRAYHLLIDSFALCSSRLSIFWWDLYASVVSHGATHEFFALSVCIRASRLENSAWVSRYVKLSHAACRGLLERRSSVSSVLLVYTRSVIVNTYRYIEIDSLRLAPLSLALSCTMCHWIISENSYDFQLIIDR